MANETAVADQTRTIIFPSALGRMRGPRMHEATCTFAEMLPLFQELFEPDPIRLTALIGRMKNFLRLNACPGVEREQGKTSHFAGRDVWELVVLMELSAVGISPSRAIEIVAEHGTSGATLSNGTRIELGIVPMRNAMVKHLPRFFMEQRKKASSPKSTFSRRVP